MSAKVVRFTVRPEEVETGGRVRPSQGRWLVRKGSGGVVLAVVALVVLGGCATGMHGRQPVASSMQEVEGSGGGFFGQEGDAFQGVQETSGLGEELRHPAGAALYVEQARELLGQVARTRVTQRSFAPRRALSWLLGEVLEGGERVEYGELVRRTQRFRDLVLVRPDGYLVEALTGEPLQRLGQVKLKEGEWKVGSLVVGDFYFSRGGVLYPVNDVLRRADTPPWAELGLERDWLNAALDGAQDAMGEMAVALAQSVLHPIRSMEDLAQLPQTVALLIASSPEYFGRYRDMSLQDQIREAARLSTHVLMLFGGGQGVVGTVGRAGGLGAELKLRWIQGADGAGGATVETCGAVGCATGLARGREGIRELPAQALQERGMDQHRRPPYTASAVRRTVERGLLRGGVLGTAQGDGIGVCTARGALLPHAGAV